MVRRQVASMVLLGAALSGCGLVDPRPAPLAQTCDEWSRLSPDQRLQTAEALIEPGLMADVREEQQLPADTAERDVFVLVGSSFDKVCEFSEVGPSLRLTEIVRSLYR
jgi:hypothetical protein